jgi:putative transposase
VCAELRNRGVRDVLIVCCDGLSGFPEAIEATWPASIVQTCTVHLLRAAMRFVSYDDRKRVAAALKPVYTAPTDEVARTELDAFADSTLGRKYPAAVMTWTNAWERFIPFLAFPPELRKIIYTTNAIWVFGSRGRSGHCFPDRRSRRPAPTLNAIDAARLSSIRSVGLAA